MALLKNNYNQPVMSAVDFLANESANKKRQERSFRQQEEMADKDAFYKAAFRKADINRDDELWDKSLNRQDYLARNKALDNLTQDWWRPAEQRGQANDELMQNYGIDSQFEENQMPLSPEAQQYFPDLRGQEAELGPKYVDLVNQRAAQMASNASRDAYYKTRGQGGSGSGSGSGRPHYTYQVPDELLPYTGGKKVVDEATYRSILDESNKDRVQKPKDQSNELYGQIGDIRAESDALNEQKVLLQTKGGTFNKRMAKKNAPLLADIEKKLDENNARVQQLQTVRNEMMFGDDSTTMKSLMPPEQNSGSQFDQLENPLNTGSSKDNDKNLGKSLKSILDNIENAGNKFFGGDSTRKR
jgi:hypothetical protein